MFGVKNTLLFRCGEGKLKIKGSALRGQDAILVEIGQSLIRQRSDKVTVGIWPLKIGSSLMRNDDGTIHVSVFLDGEDEEREIKDCSIIVLPDEKTQGDKGSLMEDVKREIELAMKSNKSALVS